MEKETGTIIYDTRDITRPLAKALLDLMGNEEFAIVQKRIEAEGLVPVSNPVYPDSWRIQRAFVQSLKALAEE